jgi:hypothetical protein
MADCDRARQAIDDFAAGEGVTNEAEPALGMEAAAIEADNTGGLLSTMLERMQAERRYGGGVRMAVDAEHAAFLAQPVAVEVQIEIRVVAAAILITSPFAVTATAG